MPERTAHSSLGKRLKALRKAAGLTQEQLAERTGLHYTTIGRFERGEIKPLHDNLRKLAESLGVLATALVSDDYTPDDVNRIFSRIRPSLRPHALRALEDFADPEDGDPAPIRAAKAKKKPPSKTR